MISTDFSAVTPHGVATRCQRLRADAALGCRLSCDALSLPQLAGLYGEWRESASEGLQAAGAAPSADGTDSSDTSDLVRVWRETVRAERVRAADRARAQAAAEMSAVKTSKEELEVQNRRMQLEVAAFRSALIRNHLARAAIRTATVASDAAGLLEAASSRGAGAAAAPRETAEEGNEEVAGRDVILAVQEQLCSVQRDLQSERLRMKLLLRAGEDAMAGAEEEGGAASGNGGMKGGTPVNPPDGFDDPQSKESALIAALHAVAEARQESADLADGALRIRTARRGQQPTCERGEKGTR